MIQKSYLCEHNKDTMQVWTKADKTDLEEDNGRYKKTHITTVSSFIKEPLQNTLYQLHVWL